MELFGTKLNANQDLNKGDVLIAEPFLNDPNFSRSVVLLCEHQEEGSFGLVVNKPALLSIEELSEHLHGNNEVFIGGPVEQNTLHFIHKFKDLEDAIPLRDGIYWGGNFEQLKSLNLAGQVDSTNCRFFIGYSGWSQQQLKDELVQNSWVISRIALNFLFDIAPEDLWQKTLRQMGEKYKMLSNYPTDPRLN
ncbi:YqgE/AlgH family protein [Flexithrix dorotheae]|uniref:YqgE/AlgH family protein n=1 Tax=Flexithrix dorotheae TaxID=70993 RepID=UPI00036A7BDA|nr:YqgE/AlgH family protein [Flexithrix dorotheae]